MIEATGKPAKPPGRGTPGRGTPGRGAPGRGTPGRGTPGRGAAETPAEVDADFAFNSENLAAAETFIARYPAAAQRSAVMPLLDLAQRQNGGWLSKKTMEYVAAFLSIPPIRVLEVATFYTMYNLAPVGRHHVQVCTNLPCWLRGAQTVMQTCQNELGINTGETTANGWFTLTEVECLGACVNAPMMQINDDYYEDLDEEATRRILRTLGTGKTPKPGTQIRRVSCEPEAGLTTLQDQETDREKKLAGAVRN